MITIMITIIFTMELMIMMTIVASQWNRCCSPEVVEDGENIVAPIVAEYQRDQGGDGTDYCCKLLLGLSLLSLLLK